MRGSMSSEALAFRKILSEDRDFHVSGSVLKTLSRYRMARMMLIFNAIIIAAVFGFFVCSDKFAQLVRVSTGHTMTGYSEGIGVVTGVQEESDPKGKQWCRIEVAPGDDSGTEVRSGSTVSLGYFSCSVRRGDSLGLIYPENDFSRALPADPVYAGWEVYVNLYTGVILGLLINSIYWGLMFFGIAGRDSEVPRLAMPRNPVHLPLIRLGDSEKVRFRKALEEEFRELSQEGSSVRRHLLAGALKLPDGKDPAGDGCGLSLRMGFREFRSYCYGIREDALRQLLSGQDQNGASESTATSGTAGDRTFFFAGPWIPRGRTPAPQAVLVFRDAAPESYVLIPEGK